MLKVQNVINLDTHRTGSPKHIYASLRRQVFERVMSICCHARVHRSVLWAGAALLLSGCAAGGVGYYWQSISGHFALMRATRPIQSVIADPSTEDSIRRKLKLAQAARAFAVSDLALPDNGSYTGYADLDRPYVLWNVFATEELSLKLRTWCFPVAGCVGYRGYYHEKEARSFADSLSHQRMDVRVGGVPAYSTLGWFDDPLPSPVLRYPETEIARLIFHELAHQVVYLKDDSTFNESFATAVETVGVERWLTHQEAQNADTKPRERYEAFSARKRDFLALLRAARARLVRVYDGPGSDDDKRRGKQVVIERLRQEYLKVKQTRWDGYAGYDRWFAQTLGNAHLAAVGAYNDRVTAFLGMLDEVDGDLTKFFKLVRDIAGLKPKQRNQRLDAWQKAHADA